MQCQAFVFHSTSILLGIQDNLILAKPQGINSSRISYALDLTWSDQRILLFNQAALPDQEGALTGCQWTNFPYVSSFAEHP
jgi:hypothetical protein